MAIGILSALEAIEGNARPDDNSVVPPIDRLASLPQAFIMQMAQKGQIPKSMVAPVLAKKAENAQLGMQMQAAMQKAQTGGAPPSTVIEKVIAQNAAQETAPVMDRSNVGVASAPMRPDMYRRGMAGGGIVAFNAGGFMDYLKNRGITEKDAARYGITSENYNKPGASFPINIIGVGEDEKQSGPIGITSLRESDPGFDDRQARRQAKINADREKLINSLNRGSEEEKELTESEIDELVKEVFPKKTLTSEKVTTDDVASVTAEEPPEQVSNEVRENNKEIKKLVDNIGTGEDKAGGKNEDTSTENIVEEIQQDQKGNKDKPAEPKEFVGLSGDDVAMLGLQFGLELLGTDQQNFFTALGKAGKPALKTALAIKQEKKKQAFTKSEREAGQQFQSALEDKKITGQKEVQELVINAPEKIQKIAKDFAIMRSAKDGSEPVVTLDDIKNAARVLGTNSSTEAAIISVVGKGVEGGLEAFNNAVRAGGVLRDFQTIAVGRDTRLDSGEEENLANAKAQLAQQRGVSPDSISRQAAAQFILDRVQKEYINKSMSNLGVAPPKFKGIVDEYFGSANRVQFSDLN